MSEHIIAQESFVPVDGAPAGPTQYGRTTSCLATGNKILTEFEELAVVYYQETKKDADVLTVDLVASAPWEQISTEFRSRDFVTLR
jgi:hypothetical protein